jgi:hypothetical protein
MSQPLAVVPATPLPPPPQAARPGRVLGRGTRPPGVRRSTGVRTDTAGRPTVPPLTAPPTAV